MRFDVVSSDLFAHKSEFLAKWWPKRRKKRVLGLHFINKLTSFYTFQEISNTERDLKWQKKRIWAYKRIR